MASNIVHLVLARVKRRTGRRWKRISLFIVPKFMVNADGLAGARATTRTAVSIEHKLGIKGEPDRGVAVR